jgi:quinoprotein glucose dehydrogenase
MMRGTPYVMRRRMLLAPSGVPCTPPPFGTLVAIDLKTGARLWNRHSARSPGWSARNGGKAWPDWGSPNLGGPIVTAGGGCSLPPRSTALCTPSMSRPVALARRAAR